ncbi:MAG: dihydropteroate synthase [Pyrinomonadaceae bacterium]
MRPVEWKLKNRTLITGERTLLMGILNVTPDSFSDGGQFFAIEKALRRAEEMIEEGADILDIGGESTRPGASVVEAEEEIRRVVRVIEHLVKLTKIPVSIDTTKAAVARAALDAGAEIVNDVSGLRFDPQLADIVAEKNAGLVLMHSRGTMETMHSLAPVANILPEVARSLHESLAEALRRGVAREQIAIDPGIGFGKSFEQNLELIARLDELVKEFESYPMLVGTSRKSFVGRILDNAPASERVYGTMATVAAAVLAGANIIRVHEVRAARDTIRVCDCLRRAAAMSGRV